MCVLGVVCIYERVCVLVYVQKFSCRVLCVYIY